ALVLGAALLGLLAAAPHRAAPLGTPPLMPRWAALDRLREGGLGSERYVRLDAKEAKLVTLAEWYAASGSAPLPARPTRAPGPAAATIDASALTPAAPPGAPARPA